MERSRIHSSSTPMSSPPRTAFVSSSKPRRVQQPVPREAAANAAEKRQREAELKRRENEKHNKMLEHEMGGDPSYRRRPKGKKQQRQADSSDEEPEERGKHFTIIHADNENGEEASWEDVHPPSRNKGKEREKKKPATMIDLDDEDDDPLSLPPSASSSRPPLDVIPNFKKKKTVEQEKAAGSYVTGIGSTAWASSSSSALTTKRQPSSSSSSQPPSRSNLASNPNKRHNLPFKLQTPSFSITKPNSSKPPSMMFSSIKDKFIHTLHDLDADEDDRSSRLPSSAKSKPTPSQSEDQPKHRTADRCPPPFPSKPAPPQTKRLKFDPPSSSSKPSAPSRTQNTHPRSSSPSRSPSLEIAAPTLTSKPPLVKIAESTPLSTVYSSKSQSKSNASVSSSQPKAAPSSSGTRLKGNRIVSPSPSPEPEAIVAGGIIFQSRIRPTTSLASIDENQRHLDAKEVAEAERLDRQLESSSEEEEEEDIEMEDLTVGREEKKEARRPLTMLEQLDAAASADAREERQVILNDQEAARKERDRREEAAEVGVGNVSFEMSQASVQPHHDPSSLCPFCSEPLPSTPSSRLSQKIASLKSISRPAPTPFNPHARFLAITKADEACVLHRAETKHIPVALRERWPMQIDWEDVKRRARDQKVLEQLEAFVERKERSEFWNYAKEMEGVLAVKDARKLVNSMQVVDTFFPGYYGEIGQLLFYEILSSLFLHCSPPLVTADTAHPFSAANFIHYVLVPELTLILMSQDREALGEDALSTGEAVSMMRASREFGRAMFPSDAKGAGGWKERTTGPKNVGETKDGKGGLGSGSASGGKGSTYGKGETHGKSKEREKEGRAISTTTDTPSTFIKPARKPFPLDLAPSPSSNGSRPSPSTTSSSSRLKPFPLDLPPPLSTNTKPSSSTSSTASYRMNPPATSTSKSNISTSTSSSSAHRSQHYRSSPSSPPSANNHPNAASVPSRKPKPTSSTASTTSTASKPPLQSDPLAFMTATKPRSKPKPPSSSSSSTPSLISHATSSDSSLPLAKKLRRTPSLSPEQPEREMKELSMDPPDPFSSPAGGRSDRGDESMKVDGRETKRERGGEGARKKRRKEREEKVRKERGGGAIDLDSDEQEEEEEV